MLSENKIKVAVGLSGGVDSSVSAKLLIDQGYDVTGVYIKCWDVKADGCAADEDRAYAVQTASKMGIKIEQLDFVDNYKEKVISDFYSEYKAGRTPNPDVLCNKEIKFGLFYKWALENGFDYVATGHYARVIRGEKGKYKLLKGVDPKKDQSYFLYLLDQEKLAKALFPVGGLVKTKVRELADKANLPTSKRPDSMGICFIGEVNIKEFLKQQITEKKGNLLDTEGNVVGEHDGAWFYTIGQRHGFKTTKYFGEPLYVLAKNVEDNTVTVGFEKEVYGTKFQIEVPHWLGENPLLNQPTLTCEVRLRHLGHMYPCTLTVSSEGIFEVVLHKPAFAIAPGQSAVFYLGEEVLGGGIIK
jgi:tRNA-uridine 2-sulfurtransferase